MKTVKKKTNWEIVIFTEKCSILVFLCPFMTFVHCWGTHLWSCITVLFFVDYVLLTIFCLLTIDYFLLTVVEYFTFFFLLVVTYKGNHYVVISRKPKTGKFTVLSNLPQFHQKISFIWKKFSCLMITS